MEFDIGGSSDPGLKESSRVLEGKIKFHEEKLARNDEEFACAQRVVRDFQTDPWAIGRCPQQQRVPYGRAEESRVDDDQVA